jgi:hypothetical protein
MATPMTAADPNWTPLLITPPFPDYTSGQACGTASIMSALTFFFGRDNIAFSAFSVASGTTRHFDSFSQALGELINARVWGGVHFRSADIEVTTGERGDDRQREVTTGQREVTTGKEGLTPDPVARA